MPEVAVDPLQEIWNTLVGFAITKHVTFHDAEDLVSESLVKALETFDAARGQLLPYARTILCNKIKNFWRDRKPDVPFDPEFNGHDPTTPLAIILREEGITMDRELINQICSELDEGESTFLLKLGETIEEIGDRAVSETARRLGLAEQEGWNTFRRIQRKAHKARIAQMEHLRETLAEAPCIAMKEPETREESAAEQRRPRRAPPAERGYERHPCMHMARKEPEATVPYDDLPMWQLAYATARDKAYTRFTSRLSGDQLARLQVLAG